MIDVGSLTQIQLLAVIYILWESLKAVGWRMIFRGSVLTKKESTELENINRLLSAHDGEGKPLCYFPRQLAADQLRLLRKINENIIKLNVTIENLKGVKHGN